MGGITVNEQGPLKNHTIHIQENALKAFNGRKVTLVLLSAAVGLSLIATAVAAVFTAYIVTLCTAAVFALTLASLIVLARVKLNPIGKFPIHLKTQIEETHSEDLKQRPMADLEVVSV
ncbi:MAG: hypothetical protein BGO14_02345 [Chlamydiales bacterium 38-26]|nr:MAG: hypothetical protein BGO14_02345 [Chlamydiales bacterium 38-26]